MSVPGLDGSVGPFPSQYGEPHVYARDIQSGAGNCVCSRVLVDCRHVEAAPGVPIPAAMRPEKPKFRIEIMPSRTEPGAGREYLYNRADFLR